MKKCRFCGELTKGSKGAAGIKWSDICQKCKDEEDSILLHRLDRIAKVTNAIWEVNNDKKEKT